jgi:hypothetical protein
MNRSEHLKWSKDRAIQILKEGDSTDAIASFLSDMKKHPELENHPALELMLMLMMSGNLHDIETFINDFN